MTATGGPRLRASGSEPAGGQRYDRRWWAGQMRQAAPLIALAVAAVIVAIITTPRQDSGLPLDPTSARYDGTRALVEVLQRVGRDVEIVTPDDLQDAPVILLLRDQLTQAERDDVERLVEAGARLVVVDPTSPLAPRTTFVGLSPLERRLEPGCEVTALRHADTVQPEGGALYEVPEGAHGCFTTTDGAWLVVEERGRGHVVAIGSPMFLMNWRLAEADNAVLAVHLLTPADSDRTVIVRPVVRTTDDGPADLGDLVPGNVRAALWQLLIGFLVLVAWRARRLGAPLVDEQPVQLASSELTTAVGALLARHDTRAATMERITADTRRRLARRLDLPEPVHIDVLAAGLAERTGLGADDLQARLEPPAPATDAELLAATTALVDLEAAVDAALSSMLEESDVD